MSQAPRTVLPDDPRVRALSQALGPALRNLLANPDVLDIHLNDDGGLWVRHRTHGNLPTGQSMEAGEALAMLSVLAGISGRELTPATPRLAVVLPHWRARLQGAIPPVTAAPTFAIRKPPSRVFELEDYLSRGIADPDDVAALRAAVAADDARPARNVLVAGGTGSGKTTFTNALLAEAVRANPSERYLILEDVPELRCSAPDRVHLLTSPTSEPPITLTDLVRDTLRFDPDRILIGEVRGPEALDLLKAWNTGHPGGIGTIHANDANGALHRLDQLCQEAGVPSQRTLIADTIHVVAHMTGKANAIRLASVQKVLGLDSDGRYRLEPLTSGRSVPQGA